MSIDKAKQIGNDLMKLGLALIVLSVVGVLLAGGFVLISSVVCGCVSPPQTNIATSQPVDFNQLTGAVVAGLRSEIDARVDAKVDSTIKGIDYRSEYGLGATITVLASVLGVLGLCGWLLSWTLAANSTKRELARIKAVRETQ